MADPASGKRLAALLWFVAAALAFIALGISFAGDRKPNWGVAAGGLFCVIMGISTWPRSRQSPPRA